MNTLLVITWVKDQIESIPEVISSGMSVRLGPHNEKDGIVFNFGPSDPTTYIDRSVDRNMPLIVSCRSKEQGQCISLLDNICDYFMALDLPIRIPDTEFYDSQLSDHEYLLKPDIVNFDDQGYYVYAATVRLLFESDK